MPYLFRLLVVEPYRVLTVIITSRGASQQSVRHPLTTTRSFVSPFRIECPAERNESAIIRIQKWARRNLMDLTIRIKKRVQAWVTGVLIVPVSMLAHHGTGISYDQSKEMTVNATVTGFRYANPHPQLF